MNEKTARVLELAGPQVKSAWIAAQVGLSPRYVRRILLRHGAPRRSVGAGAGALNHQWQTGRQIGTDGYVRFAGQPEHRRVTEEVLGRKLDRLEVVDHIDGLTLHNAPENLRLFATNAEHLRATTTGKPHLISAAGRKNTRDASLRPGYLSVDTYRRRKERGDVRLRQILLAAFALGIDSPYLLGTRHHLEKIGIEILTRPMLELAWHQLEKRWAADLQT